MTLVTISVTLIPSRLDSLRRNPRFAHDLRVALRLPSYELAEFLRRAADGIKRCGVEKLLDLGRPQRLAHRTLQLGHYGRRRPGRREPCVPGEVDHIIRHSGFGNERYLRQAG